MLNKIELKNFKCFEQINLEMGNVNVLTGINGMGKSTVIQSILLLRQSFQEYRLEDGLHLNGKYINLGVGKDVLYEKAEEDKVGIYLYQEDKRYDFEFEYDSEANILPNSSICKTYSDLELFHMNFIYISAYRIEPRLLYSITNEKQIENREFGNDGEYAIQYLKLYGANDVSNCQVILENENKDYSISNQVRMWLDAISPGVSASITINKSLQTSELQYEFTEGKNKTATYKSVNVGFGITYVLPIIVALVSAKQGDMIVIENPEAHIHPAGQRMLGELIATAGAGGVQVILETHSDHVLNGIRIAVKRGKVKSEQVKLFYFYKELENNYRHLVKTPILFANGKISEWPEGFFDEWDNALLELI